MRKIWTFVRIIWEPDLGCRSLFRNQFSLCSHGSLSLQRKCLGAAETMFHSERVCWCWIWCSWAARLWADWDARRRYSLKLKQGWLRVLDADKRPRCLWQTCGLVQFLPPFLLEDDSKCRTEGQSMKAVFLHKKEKKKKKKWQFYARNRYISNDCNFHCFCCCVRCMIKGG